MRKLIALSLITTSMFCASAFANPANELNPVKILSIFHVNEHTLQEFTHGNHPDYVLEFPEQSLVPVAFFIKGDLVDLVDSAGNYSQIKVKRTFYTRVRDGKLQFSTDLSDWKEFANFFTGAASFNITIDEGLPMLSFGLETHIRVK